MKKENKNNEELTLIKLDVELVDMLDSEEEMAVITGGNGWDLIDVDVNLGCDVNDGCTVNNCK